MISWEEFVLNCAIAWCVTPRYWHSNSKSTCRIPLHEPLPISYTRFTNMWKIYRSYRLYLYSDAQENWNFSNFKCVQPRIGWQWGLSKRQETCGCGVCTHDELCLERVGRMYVFELQHVRGCSVCVACALSMNVEQTTILLDIINVMTGEAIVSRLTIFF